MTRRTGRRGRWRREVGLTQSAVHRIWKAFGLQPHRQEAWKLSRDPQFVDKVKDVVGLYLDPPERAVVLCVDEKSQIQALDRTAPILPMLPGVPAWPPRPRSAGSKGFASPLPVGAGWRIPTRDLQVMRSILGIVYRLICRTFVKLDPIARNHICSFGTRFGTPIRVRSTAVGTAPGTCRDIGRWDQSRTASSSLRLPPARHRTRRG